ncbi:YiiX/YebB-like N1pC/P60 family cysteine hydrolase [Ottowia sp.]|uniref:YiiX/YebB-like N1pC/P60 family cysteine hydrolase n=1 Tax=Ottowia sp. TaxID=1898956 RepID=UPI003A88D10C
MRWHRTRLIGLLGLAGLTGLLGACATDVDLTAPNGQAPVRAQNRLLLTPSNGGTAIAPADLRPGDILLSSTQALPSLGIRLLTLAPVSHASLYLGEGSIAEAVGEGVRIRPVQAFIDGESAIAAFRHPGISTTQAAAIQAFAHQHAGKKYNTTGIVMQVPFSISRQSCELPFIPGTVRDACIRGLAAIQLGAIDNDRFFCSQLVLGAYQHAGLPLTSADPRLVTPADLLHMREGDVPSVRIEQSLHYVGHLKLDLAPAPEIAAPQNTG